ANLAAALASKGTIDKGDGNAEQSVLDDVNVVTQAVTPKVLRRAGEAVILWVDDRPNGNRYERQSMEALGIRFVNVVSTDEALERLKNQSFDVIISDMKRPGDDRAGYTLLDELRRKGKDIPYIIYASSNSAQHKEQAKQHGALDATNNPPELFRLVMGALKK
ncbi:response regulator, partial [Klebsiella variicola]